MKRSVTIMVVSLLVLLGLISSFAASEEGVSQSSQLKPPEPPPVDYQNISEEPTSPQIPAFAEQKTEPDPLADPNKVRARIRSFEGLEKALVELDRQSQNEMREWLQKTTDNRTNLVRASERDARTELDFIRKLAVEEKAVRTVAAIDGISLNRQERTRKLLKEMEKEAKGLRQPRGTRMRGREMPPQGSALQGQGFGQDVNQPGLRIRRR